MDGWLVWRKVNLIFDGSKWNSWIQLNWIESISTHRSNRIKWYTYKKREYDKNGMILFRRFFLPNKWKKAKWNVKRRSPLLLSSYIGRAIHCANDDFDNCWRSIPNSTRKSSSSSSRSPLTWSERKTHWNCVLLFSEYVCLCAWVR